MTTSAEKLNQPSVSQMEADIEMFAGRVESSLMGSNQYIPTVAELDSWQAAREYVGAVGMDESGKPYATLSKPDGSESTDAANAAAVYNFVRFSAPGHFVLPEGTAEVIERYLDGPNGHGSPDAPQDPEVELLVSRLMSRAAELQQATPGMSEAKARRTVRQDTARLLDLHQHIVDAYDLTSDSAVLGRDLPPLQGEPVNPRGFYEQPSTNGRRSRAAAKAAAPPPAQVGQSTSGGAAAAGPGDAHRDPHTVATAVGAMGKTPNTGGESETPTAPEVELEDGDLASFVPGFQGIDDGGGEAGSVDTADEPPTRKPWWRRRSSSGATEKLDPYEYDEDLPMILAAEAAEAAAATNESADGSTVAQSAGRVSLMGALNNKIWTAHYLVYEKTRGRSQDVATVLGASAMAVVIANRLLFGADSGGAEEQVAASAPTVQPEGAPPLIAEGRDDVDPFAPPAPEIGLADGTDADDPGVEVPAERTLHLRLDERGEGVTAAIAEKLGWDTDTLSQEQRLKLQEYTDLAFDQNQDSLGAREDDTSIAFNAEFDLTLPEEQPAATDAPVTEAGQAGSDTPPAADAEREVTLRSGQVDSLLESVAYRYEADGIDLPAAERYDIALRVADYNGLDRGSLDHLPDGQQIRFPSPEVERSWLDALLDDEDDE